MPRRILPNHRRGCLKEAPDGARRLGRRSQAAWRQCSASQARHGCLPAADSIFGRLRAPRGVRTARRGAVSRTTRTPNETAVHRGRRAARGPSSAWGASPPLASPPCWCRAGIQSAHVTAAQIATIRCQSTRPSVRHRLGAASCQPRAIQRSCIATAKGCRPPLSGGAINPTGRRRASQPGCYTRPPADAELHRNRGRRKPAAQAWHARQPAPGGDNGDSRREAAGTATPESNRCALPRLPRAAPLRAGAPDHGGVSGFVTAG